MSVGLCQHVCMYVCMYASTQARIQDFLKGGGVKTFTSTPPPLGHCPRDVIRPPENDKYPHSWAFTSTPPLDIVRVTSSALRKIEKYTHSCTFTSTPRLVGHCPCDVIHIYLKSLLKKKNWWSRAGGGGSRPPRIRACYPYIICM